MLNYQFHFVFIITVAGAIYVANETCPENEEFDLCGVDCQFKCSDPKPVICSKDCYEGCFCKDGYLRNANGACVPVAECLLQDSNSTCQGKEVFLFCGSACIETCENRGNRGVCSSECSVGCFCNPGYIRDESSNKCVAPYKCHKKTCPSPNETYSYCVPECEPSCKDPSPYCEFTCSNRCLCNDGLLRDANGKCVDEDQCTAANSTRDGIFTKYMDAIKNFLHLTNL